MPLTTIAYRSQIQTHSAECWRWATHWRCAVARLEEAIELLEQIGQGYIAQGTSKIGKHPFMHSLEKSRRKIVAYVLCLDCNEIEYWHEDEEDLEGEILLCAYCARTDTFIEYDDDQLRSLVLAKHLEVDPDEIVQCRYDENSFEVSPRMRRLGTGPKEVKASAALLHSALNEIGLSAMQNRQDLLMLGCTMMNGMLHDPEYTKDRLDKLNHGVFATIEASLAHDCLLREFKTNPVTAELLNIGTHDLSNTLFHIIQGPEEERWAGVQPLIDAFNGKEIEDWRKPQHVDDGQYLVLTDSEADTRAEEYYDSYIDDALDVPPMMENYFDRERWVSDCMLSDGRASALATYDSEETEVLIDREWYYIYRTN